MFSGCSVSAGVTPPESPFCGMSVGSGLLFRDRPSLFSSNEHICVCLEEYQNPENYRTRVVKRLAESRPG